MALAELPSSGAGHLAKPRRSGLFAEMARHWADYMYVAPAIIVLLTVIGYPFVYTIYLSFFDTPPSSPNWYFNGVDNYSMILSSQDFWAVTGNTFLWTIGSTAVGVVLGFGAALVVNKQFFGRGFIRGLLLIPWVISAVAAAYVWRWILHSDYGLFSDILMRLGLIDTPINFLDNVTTVLPSVILVNIWKEFPFAMIMLLSGLQTVPEQLNRAARIDGANSWNVFLHVTVPHLKSVLLIVTILLFVANLNSFTLVFIMTGGGPANASQLWITQVYQLAFQSLQYGQASAYSVILFVVMLGLGYYYVKIMTAGDKRRAQ